MREAARKSNIKRLWPILWLAFSFTLGCAGYERAVLLPDSRGMAGALAVKTARAEVILDQPYEAADVSADGRIEKKLLDAETVQRQFGEALAARPPRPLSFTLYFSTGKDELTPESKAVMAEVKAELATRPFPEVTVIGHTDSVGNTAYNDALSLKRAEAMRQILIDAGVPAQLIRTAGRGSREMLVPTDAGVSEPRNRRVEISVR